LHNEVLHNLFSSSNVIRVIKDEKIEIAGHVPYMRVMKNTNF